MKKKVAVAVLAVFALVAVLLPGIALAQNTTAPKDTFFQSFLDKLAANLGLEKSRLEEAVKQTELQLLDEAVQQGRLTADQAQKIRERIEAGDVLPLGPFHGPRGGPCRGDRLESVARVLGMSADELKVELDQGKTIEDIAKEKGLTLEQLHQKVLEAKIQEIQQAVKDGKLSQDKADQLIQRLQNAPLGKGF
ncbi:MAG: hypothetical protein H5T92_04340, partial [Synergistales bacterium]|nr:hypothetical protein [Synergistales bacterium]